MSERPEGKRVANGKRYRIKRRNSSTRVPERPTMDDIRKLMNGDYTMEEKRVCDKKNLEKMTALLAKLEAQLAEMEGEK